MLNVTYLTAPLLEIKLDYSLKYNFDILRLCMHCSAKTLLKIRV